LLLLKFACSFWGATENLFICFFNLVLFFLEFFSQMLKFTNAVFIGVLIFSKKSFKKKLKKCLFLILQYYIFAKQEFNKAHL